MPIFTVVILLKMRDGEKLNRLVSHTYQNYARKLQAVYIEGFRGFDKLSIPNYPDGANRRTVNQWIESDPEALFKFIKHSGRGSVRISLKKHGVDTSQPVSD